MKINFIKKRIILFSRAKESMVSVFQSLEALDHIIEKFYCKQKIEEKEKSLSQKDNLSFQQVEHEINCLINKPFLEQDIQKKRLGETLIKSFIFLDQKSEQNINMGSIFLHGRNMVQEQVDRPLDRSKAAIIISFTFLEKSMFTTY